MAVLLELGLALTLGVGVVTWWFWDVVQAFLSRGQGETIDSVLERAGERNKARLSARAEMFGTRLRTTVVRAACMAITGAGVWLCTRGSPWGWVMLGYLAFGLMTTRGLKVALHPRWRQMGLLDKGLFRVAHGWLWPLHWAAGTGSSDGNGRGSDEQRH